MNENNEEITLSLLKEKLLISFLQLLQFTITDGIKDGGSHLNMT